MTTTQSTEAAQIVKLQSDETLWAMYQSCFCQIGSALLDSNGNLRHFTDEEEAFRTALKAEVTARGLARRAVA